MYTGAYYEENRGHIPESYGGTAFAEEDGGSAFVSPSTVKTKISPADTKEEEPAFCAEEEAESEGGGFFESVFKWLPLKGFSLSSGQLKEKIKSVSLEDILILSVAALLIFSKEGDRVFGLMLIALLFVH